MNDCDEYDDVDLSKKEENKGNSVQFLLMEVVKQDEKFRNKSLLKASFEISAMKHNFNYKVVKLDTKFDISSA